LCGSRGSACCDWGPPFCANAASATPRSLPRRVHFPSARAPPALCREGKYVDVIATLKSNGGAKSFQIINVRLVEDSNHITRHFLECIYTHLYRTRGPLGGGAGAGTGAGMGSGAHFAGGFQTSVKAGGVTDDRMPSTGSDAEKVLQIYKDAMAMDPDNENGISIQDAIKKGKEMGILATVRRQRAARGSEAPPDTHPRRTHPTHAPSHTSLPPHPPAAGRPTLDREAHDGRAHLLDSRRRALSQHVKRAHRGRNLVATG
jgi:hypothetical protein